VESKTEVGSGFVSGVVHLLYCCPLSGAPYTGSQHLTGALVLLHADPSNRHNTLSFFGGDDSISAAIDTACGNAGNGPRHAGLWWLPRREDHDVSLVLNVSWKTCLSFAMLLTHVEVSLIVQSASLRLRI
jgi:hypothetical protein